MDRLYIFIIFLSGVIAPSQVQISGSVLELTVRPGDNITLHCDCRTSSGVYIKWYRNCSHVNQPSLALRTKYPEEESVDRDHNFNFLNPFPRFHLVKNDSSKSYDLLIVNITDSDEGLYYCGTEQLKVKGEEKIMDKNVYSYSNVATRISLFKPCHQMNPQNCSLCWTLMFCLCPSCAIFFSLISSLLVYHFITKTGFTVSEVDSYDMYISTTKERHVDEKRSEIRDHTRINEDEDVCYAALEIRPASKKTRAKKTQSLESCTYSDINTCKM